MMEILEPTQADRDAGWALRPHCYRTADRDKFFAGVYDETSMLQALAHHRLLGQREGLEMAAKVADAYASDAWKITELTGENSLLASGRNYCGRDIAKAIRAIDTEDRDSVNEH